MPRPNKTGLDYFPLDVHLDDKVELIEAKHGLLGFGVIIKLFQEIYRTGYYLKATEDRLLLLKKRVNVDYNLILDVINDGCKWNLFELSVYEKYQVLTSSGIQKRFVEATKRRKEVDFIKEYLVNRAVVTEYGPDVIVNINSINVSINSINGSKVSTKTQVNADIGTQSKEEKSKEENIYSRVVDYLNRKTNSDFKPTTKKTTQLIDARTKEGFTPEDFKLVIDFKCAQWLKDGERQEYLRPITLFSSKFEGYLNAAKRETFEKIIALKPKTLADREQEEKELFANR